MPTISLLGWFHTIIAIIAILSAIYTLKKYHFIRTENRSGLIYIVCTFIAAATALMIFRHGGFGPAHGLAVLTLGAIFVGLIAGKTTVFKGLSRYFEAIAFSATLLFHMIPAITDGLMRLPVDAPIVTSIEDPMLKGFYLFFLICYLVGVFVQIRILRIQ